MFDAHTGYRTPSDAELERDIAPDVSAETLQDIKTLQAFARALEALELEYVAKLHEPEHFDDLKGYLSDCVSDANFIADELRG